MNKISKNICLKIKQRRKEMGLSIADLACITGISSSCLFKYNSCRLCPNSDKLIRICKALDLNIWDF